MFIYFNWFVFLYISHSAKQEGAKWLSKLSDGLDVNILRTGSIVANSHIMPTPMGLPLNLNISGSAIFKVDGYIKAVNIPTVSELSRSDRLKTMRLEANIKPQLAD